MEVTNPLNNRFEGKPNSRIHTLVTVAELTKNCHKQKLTIKMYCLTHKIIFSIWSQKFVATEIRFIFALYPERKDS